MSFSHAWEMSRPCSDAAWDKARKAARLAFESLEDRALWGPLTTGFKPSWEGGSRPAPQSLGVWLMLNSPPARAGLGGALDNEEAIEALPGVDDWMAYPARVDRRAPSGLVSTGNKLHDLVALAALCAIEAENPGALWMRHTDGDAEHWSSSLSWLRSRADMPLLSLPKGAPGHVPGEALAQKEQAQLWESMPSPPIQNALGAKACGEEGSGSAVQTSGRAGRSRVRKA